jgi:hypothetical protein
LPKRETKEQKDCGTWFSMVGKLQQQQRSSICILVAFWTKLVYTVQYKQLQNGA